MRVRLVLCCCVISPGCAADAKLLPACWTRVSPMHSGSSLACNRCSHILSSACALHAAGCHTTQMPALDQSQAQTSRGILSQERSTDFAHAAACSITYTTHWLR